MEQKSASHIEWRRLVSVHVKAPRTQSVVPGTAAYFFYLFYG